ncbi:ricin-type beta-trefoil lectin domain protein [Streptomyces sp. NRRL S-87]|uniref:ricin-type beta-trefoil lectin domain protein n=1 Tax=Streptomyces sp. NRRL S-87 TaxID=1463920 RepID=UPI0004C1B0DE|nr:ricin-type beta-trefoil lectin domain protein [Streptomyces sp. NRRL S-87]
MKRRILPTESVGHRWRPLAAALSLALAAGLVTAASPQAGAVDRDVPPKQQRPAAGLVAADLKAQATARRNGRPVEVPERRDEHTEVLANPDGTFTWRQHVKTVRVKVAGAWRTPDARLVRRPDGSLATRATTFPMTFSGGRGGPLATMVRDGKSLSLTWPSRLPSPEVNGNTALYPEVLPGVDLKVVAHVEGFAHHLVVKNRKAAANPRLKTLTYGMKAAGVTVRTAEDGSLTAKDRRGTTVFQAPPAAMWDSARAQRAAKAATARSGAPGSGAGADSPAPEDARRMPVSVSGGTLRLVPDRTLLTGAKTVYPVVIDPVFSGGGRINWTVAYKQKYNANAANTSYWWGAHFDDGLARTGYEDDPAYKSYGTARSYFQMDVRGLGGTQIIKATFNVFNTYSWSCTGTPVELGFTGAIGTGTTWNNQPGWAQTLQTKWFAHGRSGCGAAGEDFADSPLKDLIQRSANEGGWNDVTLGLRSRGDYETNHDSWKKYSNDPHLEITYNRPPAVDAYGAYEGPWSPGSTTAKQIVCDTDPATWPIIGNNDVTLTAKVSDPDGEDVRAHFGIWADGGNGVQSSDPTVSSGNWATAGVSRDLLADGQNYRWAVAAQDAYTSSPNSPSCGFRVDRTPPSQPTVTAADGGDKPARTERTFTLAATDNVGVAGFCYSLNKPLPTSNTRCAGGTWADAAADGTATAKVVPTLWPSNQLYVTAYDKGGNITSYGASGGAEVKATSPGFVASPSGTRTGDLPGDLNGDGYADLVAAVTDDTLRLYPGKGAGSLDRGRTIGAGGWRGALITHRGDFAAASAGLTKDGYEDYLVKLGPKLYVYPNDGLGTPLFDRRTELRHPTADWSGTRQILATGNVDGRIGSDLLAVDGDALVLYSGTSSGPLAQDAAGRLVPVTAGAAGWSAYDIASPGDLDGDGIGDLLARNRTTDPAHAEFGRLFFYPGARPGGAGTYGTGARSVLAASGWSPNRVPMFSSQGNLHGSVVTAADGSRQYVPTAGKEGPDVWTATAGDATPVDYVDDAGQDAATTCPTGCLLLAPLTTTGAGRPAMIGTGDWATTITTVDALSDPTPKPAKAVNGVDPNKCMDVNWGATDDGTKVQIWDCNSSAAQQWTLPGDGTLRAVGKCLDVAGGGTGNNTLIQLWSCNGTGAQQFVPRADGSLYNPQSGRCVALPASNTTNGTQLMLWDCLGIADQRWTIPGTSTPTGTV